MRKSARHRYVKADGTSCFYFDLDDVTIVAGTHVLSLKLDCRQEANRATKTVAGASSSRATSGSGNPGAGGREDDVAAAHAQC